MDLLLDIQRIARGYSVCLIGENTRKRYRLGEIRTSYDKLIRVGYKITLSALKEINNETFIVLFFDEENKSHLVRIGYDLNYTLDSNKNYKPIGYTRVPFVKLTKGLMFCTQSK